MTCNRCGHQVSYMAMPGTDEEAKKAEAQYRMEAHAQACQALTPKCTHDGELVEIGIPNARMCATCKVAVLIAEAKPVEEAPQ